MSFPELLYDLTKDKKRIVVAGSHGKTTITAMIMHVFRFAGIEVRLYGWLNGRWI